MARRTVAATAGPRSFALAGWLSVAAVTAITAGTTLTACGGGATSSTSSTTSVPSSPPSTAPTSSSGAEEPRAAPDFCTVVPGPTVTVTGDRPVEASGVVATDDGGAWVLDDSGNPAELHRILPDGSVRSVEVSGVENVDWEELIPDHRGGAWVADVGDNFRRRSDVVLHHVDLPTGADVDGEKLVPRTVTVTYPDGPQDVEAGFVADGDVYLLTKNAGPSTIFEVKTDGADAVVAEPVGTFTPPGALKLVTGAAASPDGAVLIRTYLGAWAYQSSLDDADAADRGGRAVRNLMSSKPCQIPTGTEAQGEAISVLPSGLGHVTIGEGEQPILSRFEIPGTVLPSE